MAKYFKELELRCKCGCNKNGMNDEFVKLLDKLRASYGKPIYLSSAYRCPEHNNRVSSTGYDGPHTTGKAVDILVSGYDAHTIVKLATALGFSGIGVNQKGPHNSRFIHLDQLDSKLRPWIWSY